MAKGGDPLGASFSGNTASSAAKVREKPALTSEAKKPMKAAGPGKDTFGPAKHHREGYSSNAGKDGMGESFRSAGALSSSGERFAAETEAARARRLELEAAKRAAKHEEKAPLKAGSGPSGPTPHTGQIAATSEFQQWQRHRAKRAEEKGLLPKPKPEEEPHAAKHVDNRPAWHGTSKEPTIIGSGKQIKAFTPSSQREMDHQVHGRARPVSPRGEGEGDAFQRLAGPGGATKSWRKAQEETERERAERPRPASPPKAAPQPQQPQRPPPCERQLRPGQDPWSRLSEQKTTSWRQAHHAKEEPKAAKQP